MQVRAVSALLRERNDQKDRVEFTMRVAVVAVSALICLSASWAEAGAYRRPQDAAVPGVPVPPGSGGSWQTRATPAGFPAGTDVAFAWNGMEGPAYSYGYALNLPPDGNWRWIEPRCYDGRSGQVCVDGHWIRRQAGQCEEVSGHVVRQGRYIRVVPPGQVSTCRR